MTSNENTPEVGGKNVRKLVPNRERSTQIAAFVDHMLRKNGNRVVDKSHGEVDRLVGKTATADVVLDREIRAADEKRGMKHWLTTTDLEAPHAENKAEFYPGDGFVESAEGADVDALVREGRTADSWVIGVLNGAFGAEYEADKFPGVLRNSLLGVNLENPKISRRNS